MGVSGMIHSTLNRLLFYGFTGYGMRKTVAQRFRDGQLVDSGMHLALPVELFSQKSITVHRYNPP